MTLRTIYITVSRGLYEVSFWPDNGDIEEIVFWPRVVGHLVRADELAPAILERIQEQIDVISE